VLGIRRRGTAARREQPHLEVASTGGSATSSQETQDELPGRDSPVPSLSHKPASGAFDTRLEAPYHSGSRPGPAVRGPSASGPSGFPSLDIDEAHPHHWSVAPGAVVRPMRGHLNN
jgi:hypothetical protein